MKTILRALTSAALGWNLAVAGDPTCELDSVVTMPRDLAVGANVSEYLCRYATHLRDNGGGFGPIGDYNTVTIQVSSVLPYRVWTMRYDNSYGLKHSSLGNLISIWNDTATAVSDPVWYVGNTGTNGLGGLSSTPLLDSNKTQFDALEPQGLSFSPDNTKLAFFDDVRCKVFVYDYDAGPFPGDGVFFAADYRTESSTLISSAPAFPGVRGGTGWKDNNTVFAVLRSPPNDSYQLRVFEINATNGSTSMELDEAIAAPPTDEAIEIWIDVAYNPDLSPLVIVSSTGYGGNNEDSNPYLYFLTIDPDWAFIDEWQANAYEVIHTAIALGADGYLYLLHRDVNDDGVSRVLLDTNGDTKFTVSDLTNNEPLEWAWEVGDNFVGIFPGGGLDYAASCGECGDSDCDGDVDSEDGDYLAAAISSKEEWLEMFKKSKFGVPLCDFYCANDTNNDGEVTVGDIAAFVARLVNSTPCD